MKDYEKQEGEKIMDQLLNFTKLIQRFKAVKRMVILRKEYRLEKGVSRIF